VREDDEGGLLALHDEMVKAEGEARRYHGNDEEEDESDPGWRSVPTGNLPRSVYSKTSDDDE
jgi:hypothetical protein